MTAPKPPAPPPPTPQQLSAWQRHLRNHQRRPSPAFAPPPKSC